MTNTPANLSLTSELRVANWAQNIKRSAMQEMLSLTARPNLISFGLGLPNKELFPRETIAKVANDLLVEEAATLQYGPTASTLKSSIVELMAARGVTCREEQVFLTTGSQQAINMLARLLLNPGGQVMMEEVTYPGFMQVLEPFQADVLAIPTNYAEGIDVDAVEAHLKNGARPAFLYCITDGHNPLGISLPLEKRERLVALAREYGVPIIEDDPYGFLSYEETNLPPLRALDEDWVFYSGSFSKILAPALRVGWLVVPEELVFKLSAIKESYDIDTATWGQRTIGAFMEAGLLPNHIDLLRREYGSRRDTMLEALEAHFPAGSRWTKPRNGMFIWVELPEHIQVTDYLQRA
ncbi:MAG: aminotransferase-like domain-containing protein, partial [Tumebacillaceae bacterium]